MARMCLRCKKRLSQYNPGNLCFSCQEKQLEQKITGADDLIDAEGYAAILGLDSAEQLKRIGRDDKLAPRIPVIRKWLWRGKDIEAWFKQQQRAGDAFRKTAMGIASNLRTCRNDPIICPGPSYKIGDEVYGVEPILGTTVMGRVELIELVKVPKSTALKILQQLPKKEFPELKDITNWEDLTYDHISEDLIVRLEAYF